MSLTVRHKWTRLTWTVVTTLGLLLGLLIPTWSSQSVLAQGTLPETAAAAPGGTALFQAFDLDRDGEQWQQTDALLERVGLPDALEIWEAGMLEAGARKGDFTQADLNALLGGELALVVTPVALERALENQERRERRSDATADATPMASPWDEPLGVTAVLLPGDPDAAWDYVERQVADLAVKLDVPVEEVTHGGGELLWVEMPDLRERLIESVEGALGDADLEMALAVLMAATGMDGASPGLMGETGMDGRPGFAAGRAGDFIIAGVTQADVTEIIDVVDGTTDSLADSPEAQQVAAELPAETLSFTYLNCAAIQDAVGERLMQKLQAMTSSAEQAVLQSHSAVAVSAVEPGFRIDAVTVPGEGGSLGSAAIANDPAIAAAAERVPADMFLYQAGVVPENAFTGAAYMLALAVNSQMAGEDWQGGGLNQLPSEEEMEEEFARATAELGFDPRSELFDLLGGEFIAFSSFFTFDVMNGLGLDAVSAVTTSDPDTLAETMLKLATYIDRAGLVADVDVRDVSGNTIYVVSDPDMAIGPSLEFGVVGDEAVVGIGNGIEHLVTEPTASLADDPQFQTVMELLPSEFYQVAYVNFGQLFNAGQQVDMLAEMVGVMEESPAAVAGVATPGPAAGSPTNIRALAAVSYQRGDAVGSSAILYIADPQS